MEIVVYAGKITENTCVKEAFDRVLRIDYGIDLPL